MGRKCLFLYLGLLVPALGMAQPDHWQMVRGKTERALQEIVNRSSGVMGLVAKDLTGGEQFAIQADFTFPQGSAIKIPILMEVYKQANAGKFNLKDLLWINKKDQVGGSGILQVLGDHTSQLSIYDLSVLMIMLSDNTATNILIDLIGMENVNQTMASLGLQHTVLQRKMMDTAARGRGDENLSTPAEAARLMEILYRGEFISSDVCEEILGILKISKEGSIRAALPAEIAVAFKPGGIPGVATEWAIVYLEERPYIVTIMGNYGLEEEFHAAMERISRILYDYFRKLGRSTRYGTYVDPSLIKLPERRP